MQYTTDTSDTMGQWYVVHCKPFKEEQVAATLEHPMGLMVYLPEVRRRFRGQLQRAPIFPRYLFVRANLQEVRLSSLNAAPGVLRLVMFGEMPQPVPVAVIEALRERVDRINDRGGLLDHQFRPGEMVRLTDGPLQGLEAIFIGPMKPSERVRVLIDFLGQLREAEVDVDLVERSGSALPLRCERRTRGRGRRIKKQQLTQ